MWVSRGLFNRATVLPEGVNQRAQHEQHYCGKRQRADNHHRAQRVHATGKEQSNNHQPQQYAPEHDMSGAYAICQIGRAHVRTPVTSQSRMPSSA